MRAWGRSPEDSHDTGDAVGAPADGREYDEIFSPKSSMSTYADLILGMMRKTSMHENSIIPPPRSYPSSSGQR